MKPNLFLIGAQKSATTSLASLLERHPQVYFSPLKEPMFFCFDDENVLRDARSDSSSTALRYSWEVPADRERLLEFYEKVFSGHKDEKIVGEGSTLYLPSRKALQRVRDFNSKAKIVVMLREPVSRAYSALRHFEQRRLITDRKDYLQKALEVGVDPLGVIRFSKYKEQLENLFRLFPREQVKIVFFEEFQANSSEILDELGRFFGLEGVSWERETLEPQNVSLVPRFTGIERTFVALAEQMKIRIQPQQCIEMERYQEWLGEDGVSLKLPKRRRLRRAYEVLLMRVANRQDFQIPEGLGIRLTEEILEANLGLGQLIDRNLPSKWEEYQKVI